jgi:hypothetical protein
MTEVDVIADLKRSLHDAAAAFDAPSNADWKRLLGVALTAMAAKRPRTLLGTLTLTADEVRYAVPQADFTQYKTHVWGTKPPRPWDPSYPGALPRIAAVHDVGGWALMFDPAPSAEHIAVYSSTFKFWYFGAHALGAEAEDTTLAAADRQLLILRAQAEAMRELSMRNINKPVQLRDGFSGTPRNSTPAALYRVLLEEFEAAR